MSYPLSAVIGSFRRWRGIAESRDMNVKSAAPTGGGIFAAESVGRPTYQVTSKPV